MWSGCVCFKKVAIRFFEDFLIKSDHEVDFELLRGVAIFDKFLILIK